MLEIRQGAENMVRSSEDAGAHHLNQQVYLPSARGLPNQLLLDINALGI
jgi:hypothetical protein